ncbi:MAG: hypothetical protein HS119_01505 [Flavobacteriales bacterium]|nr:hypothetical protein [Flavobacteriales bacterium]
MNRLILHDNKKYVLSVVLIDLLHFEKKRKPFTKCEEIISYIKKEHFHDYDKSTNAYLLLKDRTITAIENGEWLMNQNQNDIDRGMKIFELAAYTDVHILVQKLLNPEKID